MKEYERDDPEFARILAEKQAAPFRPRFHLLYTEREQEQDAYFWFLQGQRVVWEHVHGKRVTIDSINEWPDVLAEDQP